MTDVLTIGGVDYTDELYGDTLKIEQAAGEFAAVCSFHLTDANSTIDITTRSAVTIVDDSVVPNETLFAGEVVNVDPYMLDVGHAGRRLTVTCRDYNVLVEEAVIDSEEAYSAQADSDIIDDLFTTYRADINSVAYVSTLDASVTITFADVTLRQALDELCGRTGGRWYVDEDKNLHYFSSEANVAAWWLSDTPDNVNSFPYQKIRRRMDASTIVNQVLVIGKEIRDSYEDAASVAAYGARPGPPVIDTRIETQAELDARGAAILGEWSEPRYTYKVTFRKTGLRAGMDVRLVCGDWAVDETLTVRRLGLFWRGGYRFYQAELGEAVATAVTTARRWLDRLGRIDNLVVTLDDTVFDTDAPATPTFTAGNLSTGVDVDADGHQVVWIQATWGLVADADLAYYQVQLSTSNDFSGYTITRNQTAGGDRIERFVGVLGNTLYYARVRAVDWVGNASSWSTTRSITSDKDATPPAEPTNFTATATPASVHLLWDANTEADLRHYELQRKPDGGAYAALATVSINFFIDNTCTSGQAYWYQIRAVDTSGNASNWVEIGASVTPDSISGDWTDLGLLGWTHDLVFSATDHNTVAWAAGDINLPNGTTYNINAGNTGNMAATTYIYLDTGVSTTTLQTTTTASAATGTNKLLVAVAQNVAAGKDAIFQVFGGEGQGVLITADNITASTITANEIAANTITATEIAAGTITATEIAAGTITGDRIAATTITGANIAAATITAGKLSVATLSAISADMGTITAGTVTGATIRTAAAGARIVLDSVDGIQAYNAGSTQTVSILPSGAGWIGVGDQIAWNTAGGLTVDGGVLVNGTVVATAFTNTIAAPTFTAAAGLLLLGPSCEINATEWHSTRGQIATLSGAFHQVPGRWAGTRALLIEYGSANYVKDSSFEHSTLSDYWNNSGCATFERSSARSVFGDYSLHVVTDGAGDYVRCDDVTAADGGETWTASCYVHVVEGDFELVIIENDGSWSEKASVAVSAANGRFQRVSVTTTLTAGVTHASVKFKPSSTAASEWYIDGVQFEQRSYATSYLDGGMGTGYAFTGDDHESSSTRTATTADLSAAIGCVSENNTVSLHTVFQAPFDHDGSWPDTVNLVWDARGADNTHRIFLQYYAASEIFRVYINGDYRLESPAQAFNAGDWLSVVVTLDFANDEYCLYIDGALADSDTTSLTAPTVTAWRLGTDYQDQYTGYFAIAEYAVFGSVLSASDIAATYLLGKLVDAGAVDKPGIYLYDGKFALASSLTGTRTTILPTEISIGNGISYGAGTGLWFGLDGNTPKFRVGTGAGDRIAWDGSNLAVQGSITITDGSGIANLTDAGDLATGDDLDDVADGSTYERIRATDISAGHIKLTSNTVVDGEWYDESGVEIDANHGINIYGTNQAFTTRASKAGTIQCYVGSDGCIYAAAGALKLSSAANLLFSVSAANQGIAWFSDAAFSTGAGYIRVETAGNHDMRIVTGDTGVAGYADFYLQTESSDGTRTPIAVDASTKRISIYGSSGATVAIRNNGDGNWPALFCQQVSNDKAVAHFDQNHATAPVIRLDGPTGSPSGIDGYISVNINGTDKYFAYYS